MPGSAAYFDGRGHNSMRLNFSGSNEDAIREGIRRIGKVVEEQVALYGTLTGGRPAVVPRAAASAPLPEQPESPGGQVVPLPQRASREGRAKRRS